MFRMNWENLNLLLTLILKFRKTINEDETKYISFYSNSKAKIVIQSWDIDSIFESVYSTIMTKIQRNQQKTEVGLLIK